MILINSLVLASFDYKYRLTLAFEDDEPKKNWHKVVAIVISIIYFAEFFINVIARGFVMTERSYLRNGWNRFDFFIVMVSIADIFFRDTDTLIIMRNLRLLKPLRSLDMMPKSKELVNTLIQAIPGLLSVIFMELFCFFSFAVMGVSIFSGSQYKACRATEDILYIEGQRP